MKKLRLIYFLISGCVFLLWSCDSVLGWNEGEVIEIGSKEAVSEENQQEETGNQENSADEEVSEEIPSEDSKEAEKLAEQEKKLEADKKRKWSLLLYMSADNNLEASALEDFAEMEMSDLNEDYFSVFVLLDRSPSYDTSNGNWSGTRLYKLKTGRTSADKSLISQQLECEALELKLDGETEIDMSSGYVLTEMLSFIKSEYPAENYGLIMWGHGTGWRSGEIEDGENQRGGGVKGFAFDETSKTYMTLAQLGEGLKNGLGESKLGFLGFDTCFGGTLEVMYELKDYAEYGCGTEGLLMSSGWNYQDLFNSINTLENKTPYEIGKLTGERFSCWYANVTSASFCVTKMNKMEVYFHAFDLLMEQYSQLITSRTIRDEVMGLLYTNKNCSTEKFSYGSDKSDIYLDVDSVLSQLSLYFSSSAEGLESYTKAYEDAVNQSIVYRWNSYGTKGGLSVYFATLASGGLLSTSHPAAYIKGKMTNQIAFVSNSLGYVPDVQSDSSFLGKLFYQSFN